MIKMNLKFFTLLLINIIILTLVSCTSGNTSSTDSTINDDSVETSDLLDTQEYAKLLREKYNYYLGDSNIDSLNSIFDSNITFDDSTKDTLSSFKNSNIDIKNNLEALKKDLDETITNGNDEVNKLNQDIIDKIDILINLIN